MTVRQAREIVKNEFESIRRWEDGEEEKKKVSSNLLEQEKGSP